MNKPNYPYEPIGSISTLARVLGLETQKLQNLYDNSDDFFFVTKKKLKSDGSFRITYDVKAELKSVHRKIAKELFKKVVYPEYLQGGIARRDYIGNASIHIDSKCIITEDMKNFFPSISKEVVIDIWKNVFHFPPDVSEILAELITYKGYLVQGCVASGYICNLVLWNRESKLVVKLKNKGFTYSRYVDDISVSSKRIFTTKEKTEIIKDLHSMVKSIGVKLNRKKHEIMPRNNRQKIHRLNVNSDQASMPKSEREKIKSAVYQCEKLYITEPSSEEYKSLFNSTQGRVNSLSRLHKDQGDKLKLRLMKIKPH